MDRKADAGWQVMRRMSSSGAAKEMLEAIFRLPNVPWNQAAFTCHHFAMRKDTPLPEKIHYFFMSAAFHKNDARIARQYTELQKLDQAAVQASIKESLQDPTISAVQKERFTQYQIKTRQAE